MLSRDVDGVVMAMQALLCQYMFDLDPTVPPIPFREEVSRFFVTYAIMAFYLLSFIIITIKKLTNVLMLALYLKKFLTFFIDYIVCFNAFFLFKKVMHVHVSFIFFFSNVFLCQFNSQLD